MSDRIDLSLVIPAFNEERRLPCSLKSICEYLPRQNYTYEVIVVDSGSTDGTSEVVRGFQRDLPWLRLIRLPKNKGKGFAVRQGILRSGGRISVFTDADLSTPIKEVERLWPLFAEGYDVVVGSRRHPDSVIIKPQSWLRRFMGLVYTRLNRWLGVKDVEDIPCGFKAFSRDAAKKIFRTVRLNGFSFDAEVLYLTQRRFHLRWAQIPIEWKHWPGSKVNILIDPFAMVLDLIKIKLYDLRELYG